MVVVALTAEGIPAAFLATVGADRSTTVGALRHGRLADGIPMSESLDNKFDLTGGIHRGSVEYVSGWVSQTKNKGESDTQGDGADQKVPEDW